MSKKELGVSGMVRLLRQEFYNFRSGRKKAQVYESSIEKGDPVLQELKQRGFAVIPNYFSAEQCAEWKAEIDRLILNHADYVKSDPHDSDHRIHAANRLSPAISKFFSDPGLNTYAENYEKHTVGDGFTLAAKMVHRENNLGSGGGWHRDSAGFKQTKAIVYLTDVNEEHGPFQYLEGSHTSLAVLSDHAKHDRQYNQNRFDENEIEEVLRKGLHPMATLTAKAGTVIVTDTRGLHRGKPIEQGERYALTNYWWFDTEMPEHFKELYKRF